MESRRIVSFLLLVAISLAGCSSQEDEEVLPLTVLADALPDGEVGTAYSATLQAAGGTTPYAWSIVSGSLPAGLTLAGATGTMSGTPTTVENPTFTVRVSDSGGRTADRSLSIDVLAPASPVITTSSLPGATQGAAYTATLAAIGGSTPYAWSVFSGTLPVGLSLNGSTGEITGSPSAAGTSNFTARVTDAGSQFDDAALSITVNAAPQVTTSSLPGGIVGVSYSASLAATGGTAPLSWSVAAGSLPAGLALGSSTGQVTGTPTASGTSNFTVRATDAWSAFDDQALSIAVVDALDITTASLADGRVGTAYSETLAAAGGTTPYSWSTAAGSLPAGLTLNGSAGAITGTPTTAGTSNFTVQVADAGSQTDTQALSITIDPSTYPRLLVANSNAPLGVKIWNNIDGTTGDRASDATLGGLTTSGALRLAVAGSRLFAASNSATDAVYFWDGVPNLANGSTHTATLPVSSFAGTALSNVYDLFVDGNGHFWICYGYVRLFLNAASLTGSSTSQAQFTHVWGAQIYAMASDTTGGKLIGGQVSGAGAICWNNPAAKTGETNAPDWTLQASLGTPSCMAIAGGRLYMGSVSTAGGAGFINIWNNIASVSAATAPNVTMGTGSSLSNVVHIEVKNDYLIATVSNPPTYKVCIYSNASAISGDTAPLQQITDAAMVLPRKAHLADDGRLYVLDQNGVLIFRGALTTPGFLGEIQTDVSGARDFLILE